MDDLPITAVQILLAAEPHIPLPAPDMTDGGTDCEWSAESFPGLLLPCLTWPSRVPFYCRTCSLTRFGTLVLCGVHHRPLTRYALEKGTRYDDCSHMLNVEVAKSGHGLVLHLFLLSLIDASELNRYCTVL